MSEIHNGMNTIDVRDIVARIAELKPYPNLGITATYSPEDNKIRLSASQRLPNDLYLRVKAAGFIWAPKQGIFVAPKWTPSREDLALELAGEIDDEDTSLVDRAEQRAERFEEYSEKRAADADRAHKAVAAIADNIPLGQPILVGHHSERHARRDAEKIETGMRRAVKMWETSKYWEDRAAGALAHAKYKERPDVRMRRIKTLEAELRSVIAAFTPHSDQRPIMQHRWNCKEGDPEIPHVLVGPKGRYWVPVEDLPRIEAGSQRWIRHYENRLIYERAMLADGGGLKADGFDLQVGGRVKRRGEWFVVTKLNKKGDVITSVSVIGHWCSTIQVEEIQDYRAPADGDAEKVQAATKQAPLVNFRKDGCLEMTIEEWKAKTSFSGSSYIYTYAPTEEHGTYRMRTVHCWVKPTGSQTCEQPGRRPVFITNAKVVPAPPPQLQGPKTAKDGGYANRRAIVEEVQRQSLATPPLDDPSPARVAEALNNRTTDPKRADKVFEGMKLSLAAGVKVVSAPQLFPTPADLAARMVDLADIQPGDSVLEPSAGTGRILDALQNRASVIDRLVAVEINRDLYERLEQTLGTVVDVRHGDFLETILEELGGQFDVILMNPPFANTDDVKHIQHAMKFLKPGGRLVAICANGPRQNDKLKPTIEASGTWEDLPAGTFESSGTGVNTALLYFEAPKAIEPKAADTSQRACVIEMPTHQQSLFELLASEGYA